MSAYMVNFYMHRIVWLISALYFVCSPGSYAQDQRRLPDVPDAEFRIAEVFDNRLELFIELYATKEAGIVDYAIGRKVLRVILSPNGETSYELAPHPFLIWWGQALWKDPEEDGINGNEEIQEDNVVFHANPYLRLYRDQ